MTSPSEESSAGAPPENKATCEIGAKKSVGTSAETGVSRTDDPINPDAQGYAEAYDVPLEDADLRLDMQMDTLPTDLERMLRNARPGAFAGLWIRHKPDYGLTVATAGNLEDIARKVRPFVAGTRWEGTVEVKCVELTEAELRTVRAEVENMLDRLGIGYGSGINIFKNRIEIDVKNRAQVERKLRAEGRRLPEHVALIERWITPSVGSGPSER